jgi:fatty acid desaturase
MLAAEPEESREEAWLQDLEALGRPLSDTSAHWRHNAIGLVYGTFIFSLFTLVVHEASHNQFLVSDSPVLRQRLNSAFGWIVCALFMRDYEGHWRKGHQLHHQRVLRDDDPQNCAKYVLEGRDLLVKLAKVWLIPFYEFELYRLWMKGLDDRCPKLERSGPSHSGARAAAFAVGWMAILIVPLLHAPIGALATTLIAVKAANTLNFVKSSLEHGGAYRRIEDGRLMARGLTFPLRNLCFPFCITPFHWEHHLVPGIPWYRLPRFRRAIQDRIPESRRDWIYTPGRSLLHEVLLP